MGLGFFEVVMFFPFLFGGGFGFPTAMPPAAEIPMMSQVAPEECLFFSTWASAAEVNSNGNPTEVWMAQPELQQFYTLLKRELKRLANDDSVSDEGSPRRAGYQFLAEFVDAMTTRSCSLFVTKFELREGEIDLEGGFVMHLGETQPLIRDKFEAFVNLIGETEELSPRQIEIEGLQFQSLSWEPLRTELVWGFHENYFWFSLGVPSMRQMLADSKTDSPAWLQQIRHRIPIERLASLSYLNIEAGLQLLDEIDEPDFLMMRGSMGFDNLKTVAITGGLDQHGYLNRLFVDFQDGNPTGIFSIVGEQPIQPSELGGIDEEAVFSVSNRFNPEQIYELIMEFSEALGGREELEEQFAEFERMVGVSVKEELIDSVDGLVNFYGSVNLMDPTSGLVVTAKINQQMVFQDAYHQINDFIESNAQEWGVELKQLVRGGNTIYTLKMQADEFMPMPFEPSWCLNNDELVLSFSRSSVSQHIRRSDNEDASNIALREPINLMFDRANGMAQGPVMVVSLDVAKITTLAYSAIRGFMAEDEPLFPGSEMKPKDLPSAEVLTAGLMPNAYAIYRTDTGFEMLHRQTFPGGSLGVTLGAGLGISLPASIANTYESRRAIGANNLRQLVIAMHNFHDAYRALPAAYSADDEGNPLLSWRVHILPYLGHVDLYNEFHLDEPWDSEHNIRLLDRMPDEFKSPSLKLEPGQTTMVVPTGEGTVFERLDEGQYGALNPRGRSLERIRDGTGQTLLIMEANQAAAVNWTEPIDFDVTAGSIIERLEKVYPSGTNIASANGAVHHLKLDDKLDLLQRMFTHSGGEVVDYEELYDR